MIKSAAYCKKCSTTIESKNRHDFKMCPCGAIGIDGGLEPGGTLSGNPDDMETRCVYAATVDGIVQYLDEHAMKVSAQQTAAQKS